MAQPSARTVLGAQMFTVREFCKTIEGLRESLKKVAQIGYKAVQLSGGGPMDPKDIAAALEDNGLTVAGTHFGWDRFKNDLENLIAEHKLYKCKHLAIGGFFHNMEVKIDDIKRFIDDLTPIAARLAKEGMDFSYHNHNHELMKIDGKTILELLYEMAPPEVLKAEIDTYWIQAGGGDPAAWVRRYGSRMPMLHLKDMRMAPGREQRFAEIGEGNLNWEAILKEAKNAGIEWYLVEQDRCYDRDPFESLAISYRNLKAMGLS